MNVFQELREQHGLTQKQLAEILHVCQQTVGNYEKGKRFPTNSVLQLMSTYYGVSTDYLMGSTDIKTPSSRMEPYELDEIEKNLINLLRKYPYNAKEKLVDFLQILLK